MTAASGHANRHRHSAQCRQKVTTLHLRSNKHTSCQGDRHPDTRARSNLTKFANRRLANIDSVALTLSPHAKAGFFSFLGEALLSLFSRQPMEVAALCRAALELLIAQG